MEARVFEKFTRGEKESAKPGIGLGLAICRAIVEAHGGTIGALNRIAADGRVEGARFWFTLPVDTPPETPDALEPLDELELPDPLDPRDSFEGTHASDPLSNPLSRDTHE